MIFSFLKRTIPGGGCIAAGILFLSLTGTIVQDPWKAPQWADTLINPYQANWGNRTISPEGLRNAQELYLSYCTSCHGKNGEGDGVLGAGFNIKPANFYTPEVISQKDGALFWKLSEGRGNMPSYKGSLSEEERWKLVTYIRHFSTRTRGPVGKIHFDNEELSSYDIKSNIRSSYFPLPADARNLVKSEDQNFMVDTVVAGLGKVWSMAFLPDASMLITERSGKLLRVKDGKLQEKPVGGNIPKELRDIKLHPEFDKNRLVYISYYIDPVKPDGGYTALMRGRLEGDQLVDTQTIYKAGPFNQGAFFYGSKLASDGKGHLFFTVGISGARTDAQDLSKISGKTIRLNEDGSIPSDNPFVNTVGALPEIYSYGHRMHEGLHYDTQTSTLWSTEFGELGGDEFNIIKAGANYGWPEVTFSREYSGQIISADSLREDVEAPVFQQKFGPSDMALIRDSQYPQWNGNIFIGGLPDKSIFRAVLKNNTFIKGERLLENVGRVRDVKLAPDGLLYIMTEDSGIIVRLIPLVRR